MTLLANHSERNVIRLQLKQNEVLKELEDDDRVELESHLSVFDGHKGEFLLYQGVREMEQYFIIDGIVKRVVANAEGKEMILRFADEREAETSYAAWRLGTPTPYGIVCVTKVRVARMYKSGSESTKAFITQPIAHSSPPTSTTGRGPKRSTR